MSQDWIGYADQAFHEHLDSCPQCMDDPCNLCARGDLLLVEAANEIATICREKLGMTDLRSELDKVSAKEGKS